MSTASKARERLGKLVEWHRKQAMRAGVSRHAARFHENSATCLDALITTVKDDALAFIDAADELYSAFCESKKVDKRQRGALDDFASASNQWAQHPRKCSS